MAYPPKNSHRSNSRSNSERKYHDSNRRSDSESKRSDRSFNETKPVFCVCGIHPVEEALATIPRETLIKARLYIADTRRQKELGQIFEACERLGLNPMETTMQELSLKTGETRHQGVLLDLPGFNYADLDDVLEHLSANPLILVLDQIQDPHNLGAIIRSAVAFGADAIIIPKDRAAQMTATSFKTSAGQAYRIPICRVANIAQTLRKLKDVDFNVVGADIEGCGVADIDFRKATALVMGSEGDGMRRLTRTLCDQTVRIAQNPVVESLNVSVATAILLYAASNVRKLDW